MKEIKRKHILYGIIFTIIIYGIIHYFETAAGFVSNIFKALMPFAAGAVMAYILNILLLYYEGLLKKYLQGIKGKRIIAIVVSILTFVIVIALLLGIIIPQLVKIIYSIVNTNPDSIEQILAEIMNNEIINNILSGLKIDINDIDIANQVTKVIQEVMRSVGNVLTGVITGVSGVFNTLISFFMAMAFAIYILMDKEKLSVQGDKILRAFFPKYRDGVLYILNIFNTNFKNYFVSQVKEAMILGVLLYVVMLIAGLSYAPSISVLVAVTALIPVVGAYVGLFIGALMILTTSFKSMVIFIILHTLVQQFENNVIYPRVVGSSVGLPGMWVIVAVALGGAVSGVTGVFIAVPVAAGFYYILKTETEKRL